MSAVAIGIAYWHLMCIVVVSGEWFSDTVVEQPKQWAAKHAFLGVTE